MNKRSLHFILSLSLSILALTACARAGPDEVREVIRIYVTATPGPSATPPPTSTTTPTATPTLTPTPTAPPVLVAGDPRAIRFQAPISQGGAPCGLVDLLDFPLDPPDADDALGGLDFGVFRRRYDKFHAGEDWGMRGRSNFGEPVYSVGHGQVTYAEPKGWGADQGVVIIRHVFRDGRTILSFYGHLDPPSIVRRAGDCVLRGEQLGKIGRPRGFPHLHFEIRSHLPDTPGPGYWPVDPTLAGWEPPSAFIWQQRMASSPGVVWAGSLSERVTRILGLIDEETLVALAGDKLVGVSALTGEERWVLAGDSTVDDALLDSERGVIYTVNQLGELAAIRWPAQPVIRAGEIQTETLQVLWSVKLDAAGKPRLLPTSGWGVVVAQPRAVFGVSVAGSVNWQSERRLSPISWLLERDRLIFTTLGEEPGVWTADEVGLRQLAAGVGGLPVRAGKRLYVYDPQGVYLLDETTGSTELLYALPPAFPNMGDLVALPEGGLLLAHTDRFDQRLVAFEPDGTLRWERSLSALSKDRASFQLLADQLYLLLGDLATASKQVDVFAIELERGDLTRVFSGGTRAARLGEDWTLRQDERYLLIHLGEGSLVSLDPALALEAMSQTLISQ